MLRPRITATAKSDIRAIVDWIAQDNAAAATKVRVALKEAIERLAKSPSLGHLRKDLTDLPVRFYRVYSWFIIYHDEMKPLTVLRVIHTARDLQRLLKS
jgi:plasmid stabilization system protein ParE